MDSFPAVSLPAWLLNCRCCVLELECALYVSPGWWAGERLGVVYGLRKLPFNQTKQEFKFLCVWEGYQPGEIPLSKTLCFYLFKREIKKSL